MRLLGIEITKLLKYNWKKILMSTLILGTLMLAISFFRNLQKEEPDEKVVTIDDSTEEIVFKESIAYFQYYVEREDGVSFTNTPLINFYITHDDILRQMSESTGVELEGVVYSEEFQENDVTETDIINNKSEESDINITIIKGDHSHVYTFIAKTERPSDNLKIANFYYEMINNNEVPFYEDKFVYTFSEPQVRNEYQGEIGSPGGQILDEAESQNRQSVLQAVAGYVLSLIIVTGFIVIQTFLSKKLIYSFSYLWNENDLFIIKDPRLDNREELIQFISYPGNDEKIVVNQQNELPFENTDFKVKAVSSVSELSLDEKIKEVILVVNEGLTTRKWYKKQQNLLSIHKDTLVKIIQINK